MNAVDVENLVHTYPAKRSAAPRSALKGVSFSVNEGEMFALLGPNGGGKSTTFHILSTYFPPSGGRAAIFGHDVQRASFDARRALGVVFQAPGLDGKLTVFENLIHQGHLYGLSGQPLRTRISASLERLGLSSRKEDLVESLSGGLKRRVEIVKGLLHQPRLLLLDEPSTGLDPAARRDLWDYLRELQGKDRMTIVLTTHLMEEADRCDRIAILDEGVLVALGTPAALKEEIGGDVISVESKNPLALQTQLAKKYGVTVKILGTTLRLEQKNAHEFIPRLIADFPGQIVSVTFGKPTLDDVFIRKTGHRLDTEEPKSDA